jgi:hypothetical protein
MPVVSEQSGNVRSLLQETERSYSYCINSCSVNGSQPAPMPAATALQQLALLLLAA